MDFTISRRLSSGRLYAYYKKRFWFWDDTRNVWTESHLMSQKYEREHSARAALTPEDFMSDLTRFSPLDEYELDSVMVDALKNAIPCKTAPIEPVEDAEEPCKCSVCTCSGCKEECFGNCRRCGHPVQNCNSFQTGGEKHLQTSKEESECTTSIPGASPQSSESAPSAANASVSSALTSAPPMSCTPDAPIGTPSGMNPPDKPLTTIPDDLRPAFDYSGLSEQTVLDLHLAENEYMQGRKMAERGLVHMGNAIATAHDALCGVVQSLDNSKHGNRGEDSFRMWCLSIGISKSSAYNLLQVSALLENSSPRQKEILEALPPTLLYAAAKPSAPQELVERVQTGDITTNKQYQEALKQLKAEKERADAAEKRCSEWTAERDGMVIRYNAECNKRRQAESELDETRARLKNVCIKEQESRDAMQAAESARDAALADVNGLSEQNAQLRQSYNEANDDRIAARLQCQKAEAERDKAETRAKNAEEALKKQPITAVVDEEEVDRRAHQQAYGIAADMTAELKASRDKLQEDNAALQQQLDEARSVDPQEDLENVIACRVNLESAWSMARSCSNRLVGTGESLNNALHAIISLCDSIHKEAVSIIIKNDKETQYE